ncbi:MAG: glycoside hydrolase family 2 [Parabacteroides gordonii]|nr:glycoside hydrolase family 2 [Parabacteroides gordonii]
MKKYLSVIAFTLLAMSCSGSQTDNLKLESDFLSPPESVQTSVYWYWMCGNISKEGVIKDLEEMKRVGINRAFIGHNYFEPYEGGRNVRLMSDEWWDILHTALKKASELNIEIGLFNSPGWTQAGGPWIKPSESMRYLTHSDLTVKGPQKISIKLDKPKDDFQDVKVVAYPSSSTKQIVLNSSNAQISVSPTLKQAEKMFDGNRLSDVRLSQDIDYRIDIKTQQDFTARSLTIYPSHSSINATFELQVKDGNVYRTISNFVIDWHHLAVIVGFQPFAPIVMTLDETKANEFRLLVKNSHQEGGIAEVELSSVPQIENYAAKTFAKMFQDPLPQWDYYMWRDQPEVSDTSLNIDPKDVLDISAHMTADGTLTWNVPEGEWTISRTGMTSTTVTNNPAGPDGTGLEVDKINKKHVASHFDAFIGKILERIPAEDRKTFKVVVQDSYESGGQNFTDGFLESFKERYGYDALPFIPAYFGQVVGSQVQSDKFLWDMRRLVADRVAYEYVGGFRELSHKHGLTTWLENYGHWGFPAEFLMYGGQSDEVGGEYWLPNVVPSWENNLGQIENRAASSCAHIYGKPLVSAESNTSGGPAFSRVPADAKKRTDKYFSEGINNTLLHVFIQQADTNRYPGTNAWFGTEFYRTNTWYSHIDLFLNYVKRCNYMLRQGLNIADIAYFIGEDVPKMTGIQDPALPLGRQFDYINAEVLLRDATVKDGLITLPHGTTYRVLVLPRINTMRPELLAKIKQMIMDGAIVLGTPPTHSPSLQNQPQADELVKMMAAELWKDVDGVNTTSAKVGKGMLFNGVGLEEVFSKIGCVEDCKIPANIPFLFGHRKMDNTEIYFISNQDESTQKADLKFRVTGLRPELFDPITGKIRELTEFSSDDKGTTVPVTLHGYESGFIVFRKKGEPIAGTKNFPEPVNVSELKNAWNVKFNGKLSNPASIRLEELQDLSKSSNDSIKYFSGNMIYTTTFDFDRSLSNGEKIYLDLGEVNKLAKVWVNEQYVGGAWTMPYHVDISSALKQGKNVLRIDVVNTWVNRMIGDKNLPKEQRETWAGINDYQPDSPLQKTGLIGPVKLESIKFK